MPCPSLLTSIWRKTLSRNTAQRFNAQDFTGIVHLKGFNMMPDGKQYIGIAGRVSVLRDEEVVGFEVRGGETANWICRIDGPNGSINVLGCQVRMVHQFDNGIPADLDGQFYKVP
jgi:hypothetical protein